MLLLASLVVSLSYSSATHVTTPSQYVYKHSSISLTSFSCIVYNSFVRRSAPKLVKDATLSSRHTTARSNSPNSPAALSCSTHSRYATFLLRSRVSLRFVSITCGIFRIFCGFSLLAVADRIVFAGFLF